MNNEGMRIDPVTRWNGHMVEQVVRSMWFAHQFSDTCWSLHQVKGSPRTANLTVGRANVIHWDWILNHLLIDALFGKDHSRTGVLPGGHSAAAFQLVGDQGERTLFLNGCLQASGQGDRGCVGCSTRSVEKPCFRQSLDSRSVERISERSVRGA